MFDKIRQFQEIAARVEKVMALLNALEARPAALDADSDGTVESVVDELKGLAGKIIMRFMQLRSVFEELQQLLGKLQALLGGAAGPVLDALGIDRVALELTQEGPQLAEAPPEGGCGRGPHGCA